MLGQALSQMPISVHLQLEDGIWGESEGLASYGIYEGMYGICTPLQNSGGRYVIGTNSFWNLWDQCGVRASVHWKLVQNLWKTTELGILICNSPCSRKLSEKSSKTEYMYPQFCISFSTIFRLETPPSNMTTKL